MSVWTSAEEAVLSDTSLTLTEVMELTGHTRAACKYKARQLGIDRSFRGRFPDEWSDGELAVVRNPDLTYGQVAEITGRSLSAVEHMSIRQGIDRSVRTGIGLKVGDDNPWTERERAILADTSLSLLEVSDLTGRPYASVKQVAHRLGIKRHDGSWVDSYRGPGWRKVRSEVLERDGYMCQDCGFFQPSGKNLHVHHIIPYRLLPANLPRWLVVLCNDCHSKRPEHRWREIPAEVAAQL